MQNGYGATRCECCDLPSESCGRALEQQERVESARHRGSLVRAGWFPAQYAGACGTCGEWFKEGSLIHAGPGAWEAECCA